MDEEKHPNDPRIDYDAFEEKVNQVKHYRLERLLDIEAFKEMLTRDDVLLLDTRSTSAYHDIHIKGAVHLNFSEFTDKKLASVIPSKDTCILIYCNNNFARGFHGQLEGKRPALALNIPTFINLYGYGYKNIYELSGIIRQGDGNFEYEGADIDGLLYYIRQEEAS